MRSTFRFLSLPTFFTVFSIIFLFLAPATGAESPIQIEADHMTSTEKTNSVVFTGDVDAKQGDVRIRSDKMTVHYTEAGAKKSSKGKGATQQVEKLVCIGNVEITRAEWLGTSKKMIYKAKERQVILIDNAKAWQDQNMVSGSKIIYYLDEGRSEVIGDPELAQGPKKSDKKGQRVNMTIIQK